MLSPDFSDPSPAGYYDVFLSFRGKDTRKGFTTNLYHALLEHQIHTFMDEDLMGEEIKHLFTVIEKSRMAVVIYSKDFASSHWCLQELETILQRKKEEKMMLTPIFYKVNLNEVKHLTGQTAEELNKHLTKHDKSTVETWKAAVTNFGKVSGLSYKDNDSRSERVFIGDVIDKIKKKLRREHQQTQEHSVDHSSKGVKDLVTSQWPSSSDQGALHVLTPGQPEGMVAADKQAFTYGEILKITNNLEKRIKQGSLGDVYSGKLNGSVVAVKIFPRFLVQKIMQNGSDYAEACQRNLLKFRHENLVSLVGYCFDGENVAHINEFMENGSLRYHLSEVSPRFLTWKERLKIAGDIAEGLQFLHGTDSVTFGNLQTTDILFNEKMTAKILYFPSGREAASTSPYDRYITSLIVDGASFMSQSPLHETVFHKKLDLYSFAMILYELVTGHAPRLTTWQNFVNNLSQNNLIVDSRLVGAIDSISIGTVIQLASTCAQMQILTEPLISDVLVKLKVLVNDIEPLIKGVKDLVTSQWPSSSDQGALHVLIPGQPEGMVADKQAFTYGEILKITNNLEKLIARGGLGDVYSGKLNGAAVTVKIFPRFLVQKIMKNGSDCAEECQRNLLQFRHENLVSLVGYCCDDENVAHINEFIENGSLRYHLSGVSPRFLTWKERLKIARDIAEGLQYLHGNNVVCHGNLQTTNILFNEKMTAKILYFPCAREADSTSPYDRYITSLIVDGGSFMSQNPLNVRVFHKKMDLHSFAMILYELVTGHAPPLTTWQNFVNNLSQNNLIVDSRLVGAIDSISIGTVIKLASNCAQMENLMEPLISDVLVTLKDQHRFIRVKDLVMGS